MKKVKLIGMIISLIMLVLGIFMTGYTLGVIHTQQLEQTIRDCFSDEVVPVRQGKLAGAVIYSTGNATMIEAWEELCTDILREFSEYVKDGGSN